MTHRVDDEVGYATLAHNIEYCNTGTKKHLPV